MKVNTHIGYYKEPYFYSITTNKEYLIKKGIYPSNEENVLANLIEDSDGSAVILIYIKNDFSKITTRKSSL